MTIFYICIFLSPVIFASSVPLWTSPSLGHTPNCLNYSGGNSLLYCTVQQHNVQSTPLPISCKKKKKKPRFIVSNITMNPNRKSAIRCQAIARNLRACVCWVERSQYKVGHGSNHFGFHASPVRDRAGTVESLLTQAYSVHFSSYSILPFFPDVNYCSPVIRQLAVGIP